MVHCQNEKFSEIKLIGFGNQTYIERIVVKCRLALRACEVVIFSGKSRGVPGHPARWFHHFVPLHPPMHGVPGAGTNARLALSKRSFEDTHGGPRTRLIFGEPYTSATRTRLANALARWCSDLGRPRPLRFSDP